MTNIQNKRIVQNNSAKNILKKRQWTKYISNSVALSLLNYNPRSPLKKSYMNTYFCIRSYLGNENGTLTTTYCKNKWCAVCARIKTAININEFAEPLAKLKNLQFVTLTLPTCHMDDFPEQIKLMENSWRKINNLSRKAKYKKTNSTLTGIKKAEFTLRPQNQIHYHFHLLIENEAQANFIVNEWLRINPTASRKAQDIRKADIGSMQELFKYTFKSDIKDNSKLNFNKYDKAFIALKGKRMISSFGNIKKVKEDFDNEDLQSGLTENEFINTLYTWNKNDWYNTTTGEALVNEDIPDKVKNLASYPSELSP